MKSQPCLRHGSLYGSEKEAFCCGKVNAIELCNSDIISALQVTGALFHRSDGFHAINPFKAVHCLIIEQCTLLAVIHLGLGRDVDLGQASHGSNAFFIGSSITDTDRDQHHNTHDTDGHGQGREDGSGLAPPQVHASGAEEIPRPHMLNPEI